MLFKLPTSLLALLAVAHAAQPSAPSPVSAPIRELPWGQLNFLHTTDTHGWHAGHLLEPSYSADWGDYISFTEHLQARADREGSDLLIIDTGDRIEGNGLYDASDPKGKYTADIFKQQRIDIICTGNHELYKKNSSDNEYKTTVPNFRSNYVASNLDIFDPETGDRVPLAPRYRTFKTKNQGIRVLAFGFLFDFFGNANNTVVQPVEMTVKETWFQDALREKDIDLFVVAGHVAVRSEEYKVIHKAIREVKWDTPIMFFGGHYHIRDYKKWDSKAYALASGRYMETLGFQSISGLPTRKKDRADSSSASLSFARRYIDNNLFSLAHHAGVNVSEFPTEKGRNVSAMISDARKEMKLDSTFGCAPRDFWTNRAPYPDNSSIFTWLEQAVLPTQIVEKGRNYKPRIVMINTGAMRFDIFKGAFTKDSTFIVSPFTSGFRYIKDVPYEQADRLLAILNRNGQILQQLDPQLQAWTLPPPEQQAINLGLLGSNVVTKHRPSAQIPLSEKEKLIPGYTTIDDAGNDGDDTVHSQINFYAVPNVVEARVNTIVKDGNSEKPVEKVDLVYLEFIEPWILAALEFLGLGYKIGDTMPYLEGQDFTTLIAEWIRENWKGDC
jgi:2',3'-cyclic-nucleotide 2'-phosphodiesterase (5'-nucleotidase family)